MSQAKVEEYKKYKQNRKKILKKEQRKKVLGMVIGRLVALVIVAAIVFGIGYWGVGQYKKYQDAKPVYTTDNYILSDLCGVDEEETTEAETTTEAATTEAKTE